jgi:hypothetical protein
MKCKACSYTPPTEPETFCPACGTLWDKAKPPVAPDAPKPVVEKKPIPKKPAVKKTSGSAKRNKK